jgi:lipid-binding SYLF domain-containing protein
VAAVFPPWWSPAQVIGAAGSAGDIAGVGAVPFIVILRGDAADLSQRARSAGALALLDPALAGACARPTAPEIPTR